MGYLWLKIKQNENEKEKSQQDWQEKHDLIIAKLKSRTNDAKDVAKLKKIKDKLRFATTADLKKYSFDELVETLPPQGHFEPAKWLYEQLCLAMPQRQLCDQACEGIVHPSRSATKAATETDQRWAALSALKQQLSD